MIKRGRLKKHLKMTYQQRKLFNEIVERCVANDVTLTLANSVRVVPPGEAASGACSGVFDEESELLAVAVGKPFLTWLPTLIHEYCHLCQYKDDVYTDDDELHNQFWPWLEGKKKLSKAKVEASVKAIVGCELDCERRVLNIIKRRDLGIDPERYVQRANSYLFFYRAVADKRQWYKKKAPHEVKAIIAMMPTKLFPLKIYLQTPNSKYLRLLEKKVF